MRDACAVRHRLHGGHQAVGKSLGVVEQGFGRLQVVVANFPAHLTLEGMVLSAVPPAITLVCTVVWGTS